MCTGSFVYIIVIDFSCKTFSISSKTDKQVMKTFNFMCLDKIWLQESKVWMYVGFYVRIKEVFY